MSDYCPPSTIISDSFSFFPGEDRAFIPDNGASVLSLHQIPKAEEGIPTEVNMNQGFDLIASPIKPKRALSKRIADKRAGEIMVLG